MRKIKKILLGLPVLAFALSAATGIVYAHDGEDHSSGSVTSHDLASDDQHNQRGTIEKRTSLDERKTEIEQKAREATDRFRKGGDDLLHRLRAERKDLRTAEQRKKNCENRKIGLQNRINALEGAAERHLQRVDSAFDKVINYQKEKDLSIENFDALVVAAQTAQTKAAASTQALDELKPTVDCSKETIVSDIATFKEAVTQARNDLQAYRSAVKDILKAAESARKQGA